jgi:hypothetical protein
VAAEPRTAVLTKSNACTIEIYYRGTMDPTGQRLAGTLQGSGFTGQVMELVKQ